MTDSILSGKYGLGIKTCFGVSGILASWSLKLKNVLELICNEERLTFRCKGTDCIIVFSSNDIG